jgi:predicted amidophosphoribosyltransferase
MKIFRLLRTAYAIVIEALFPLSPEEKLLEMYGPKEAHEILPKAPAFKTGGAGAGGLDDYKNMMAVFAYKDKRVSRLVWNIKYKKSKHSAEIAGYALANKIQNLALADKMIIIIPMPITDRRRKERGYNQCELICDEIKKNVISKDISRLSFSNEILLRTHHDKHHKFKNREDRLASAKGLFKVDLEALEKLINTSVMNNSSSNEKGSLNIKEYAVMLIDDVITTGSTMREALETLKVSGFEKVMGLALAH